MPTLDLFLKECSDRDKPVLSNGVVNCIIDPKEKERILNEFSEETKLHASPDSVEHRRCDKDATSK